MGIVLTRAKNGWTSVHFVLLLLVGTSFFARWRNIGETGALASSVLHGRCKLLLVAARVRFSKVRFTLGCLPLIEFQEKQGFKMPLWPFEIAPTQHFWMLKCGWNPHIFQIDVTLSALQNQACNKIMKGKGSRKRRLKWALNQMQARWQKKSKGESESKQLRKTIGALPNHKKKKFLIFLFVRSSS